MLPMRPFVKHWFLVEFQQFWSVCREDAKRPDGMSLIPWEGGHPLLWDFTCCDSVAPSNCTSAARGSGVLAYATEEKKCRKYSVSFFILTYLLLFALRLLEHGEKVLENLSARLVPEYEKPLASQDRPLFDSTFGH